MTNLVVVCWFALQTGLQVCPPAMPGATHIMFKAATGETSLIPPFYYVQKGAGPSDAPAWRGWAALQPSAAAVKRNRRIIFGAVPWVLAFSIGIYLWSRYHERCRKCGYWWRKVIEIPYSYTRNPDQYPGSYVIEVCGKCGSYIRKLSK